MRRIKTFRVFESNYNFEEFVDVISIELLKYNLDASKLNLIISQKAPEIEVAINNGENPLIFAKEIAKELQLGDVDKLGMKFPYSTGGQIKYL